MALELEGKGKKGKGRGGEQGGKSKPEKVTKLPNKSVIAGQASDHYNNLKNVSILFTKSFNCASAITKTDVIVGISELEINSVKPLSPNGEVSDTVKCNNTVLEGLYDQMDTYVETAIKVSRKIQNFTYRALTLSLSLPLCLSLSISIYLYLSLSLSLSPCCRI